MTTYARLRFSDGIRTKPFMVTGRVVGDKIDVGGFSVPYPFAGEPPVVLEITFDDGKTVDIPLELAWPPVAAMERTSNDIRSEAVQDSTPH